MKNKIKILKMKISIIIVLALILTFLLTESQAQVGPCNASVPTYYIDFSSVTSDSTWVSALVVRNAYCCGTSGSDRCINFVITTGSQVTGLAFNICEGALPPGALSYQVDCGPPINYNDIACITTPGVHYLTFCKPGNNVNRYCITATASPISNCTPDLEVTCPQLVSVVISGSGCKRPEAISNLNANIAAMGLSVCSSFSCNVPPVPDCELNETILVDNATCIKVPDETCHQGFKWHCTRTVSYDCQCSGFRLEENQKQEQDGSSKLFIYPNPTEVNINIEVTEFRGSTLLQVVNSIGQVVHSKTLELINEQSYSIGVTSLTPGLYTVLLSNKLKLKTGAFVKQ